MIKSKSISKLATVGYAAKGLVYGIVGVLAAMAAFGDGGQVGGPKEALQQASQTPFGGVLLVLIGVGLLAYGIFRLLGAFADIEAEGSDKAGVAKRMGYFGSGLAHLGLAAFAFGGLGSSAGKETLVAKVLGLPGGTIAVAVVGLSIIGAGVYQWVKALAGKYRQRFSLDQYSPTKRRWVHRIAKLGLISRGVIFPLIGGFLVYAALTSDPEKAKGMGGALETLASQPGGVWLMGMTALGLLCYGIYCEVLATYGHWGRSSRA